METLKILIQGWGCTSAATYHRLLKLVPKKGLDTSLLFHGQRFKSSYLYILRIHEY